MSDHDQQPESEPSETEGAAPASPYEAIPIHVRERLATVALALAIAPTKSTRRGGIVGMVTGEVQSAGPSVTDALRIARFACDDHRDITGVDPHETFDSVTAHDLLSHLTNKES